MSTARRTALYLCSCATIAFFMQAGCQSSPRAQRATPSLDRSSSTGEITELEVQALVMGMADDYISELAEIAFDLEQAELGNANRRWLASVMLRDGTMSAIDIATGPNPDVALLDMLFLVSVQRGVFERYWQPEIWKNEAGNDALERLKLVEERLWSTSSRVLTSEQHETFRELIDEWLAGHPQRVNLEMVRFDEFTDVRNVHNLASHRKATGLLVEVNEATRAIDDARLLGERLFWYANRLPFLIGQQAEVTAFRLADQPEIESLHASLESFRADSRRLTELAERLPIEMSAQQEELQQRFATERDATLAAVRETFAAEREATFDHFFDRLRAERTAFLDDIEAREGQLASVMQELEEVIVAATRLAEELQGTALAVDQVVSRFDQERDPDDTSQPMRITDIRDAAIETTKAAEQLAVLLDRTNELLGTSELGARVDEIGGFSDRTIDRIFWRGVILIAIIFAGVLGLRFLPRPKK